MFGAMIIALLLDQTAPEIVRFANGELAFGYEAGRGCHAPDECGDFIRHMPTGEIIMYQDQWIDGYQETGRGKEVVKIDYEDQSSGE